MLRPLIIRSSIGVTRYFVTSCPHCHDPLRIRTEYLGLRVCCNHCDRDFVAQAEGGATAPSPAPLAKEAVSGVEEEAAAAAENPKDIDATTSRPLREALAQLDQSRHRVDELQGQLDLVRLQLCREALLRQDLETIRAERDRLRGGWPRSAPCSTRPFPTTPRRAPRSTAPVRKHPARAPSLPREDRPAEVPPSSRSPGIRSSD